MSYHLFVGLSLIATFILYEINVDYIVTSTTGIGSINRIVKHRMAKNLYEDIPLSPFCTNSLIGIRSYAPFYFWIIDKMAKSRLTNFERRIYNIYSVIEFDDNQTFSANSNDLDMVTCVTGLLI